MFGSQIDELRKSADEWNASNMFELARMCREAADIITDLRDDLQRANAENARLREENQSIGMAAYEVGYKDGSVHYELEHCSACKNIADLQEALEENAKLRELVCSLHRAYVGALNEAEGLDAGIIWEYCDMIETELAKSHAKFEADRHRFDVAMSELGIEVD